MRKLNSAAGLVGAGKHSAKVRCGKLKDCMEMLSPPPVPDKDRWPVTGGYEIHLNLVRRCGDRLMDLVKSHQLAFTEFGRFFQRINRMFWFFKDIDLTYEAALN